MEFKGTKGERRVEYAKHGVFVMSGNYCISKHGDTLIASTQVKADALLHSKALEMLEAMQEFCDRADRGEVRSTKTYNKFKSIIKSATTLKEYKL